MVRVNHRKLRYETALSKWRYENHAAFQAPKRRPGLLLALPIILLPTSSQMKTTKRMLPLKDLGIFGQILSTAKNNEMTILFFEYVMPFPVMDLLLTRCHLIQASMVMSLPRRPKREANPEGCRSITEKLKNVLNHGLIGMLLAMPKMPMLPCLLYPFLGFLSSNLIDRPDMPGITSKVDQGIVGCTPTNVPLLEIPI